MDVLISPFWKLQLHKSKRCGTGGGLNKMTDVEGAKTEHGQELAWNRLNALLYISYYCFKAS